MSIRRSLFALVFGVAIAGCGTLRSTTTPLANPQQAPDFTLTAQDGRRVALGELIEDGPAVLVFNRGHR